MIKLGFWGNMDQVLGVWERLDTGVEVLRSKHNIVGAPGTIIKTNVVTERSNMRNIKKTHIVIQMSSVRATLIPIHLLKCSADHFASCLSFFLFFTVLRNMNH